MAKYRILKVTLSNNEEKYIIQKKFLFWWKQAYYDEEPWTYKAITKTLDKALMLLTTKFNVYKSWEVIYRGESKNKIL